MMWGVLAGVKRRVMGITWTHEPAKGRFQQVLKLGAV
jgi:hypothetical protein